MSTGLQDDLAPYAQAAARFCLSLVFLWSGIAKLLDFSGGVAEVAGLGLPMPVLFLTLTILCQIGGGLMVLLGIWARLGALALAGFTILATLLAHGFWTLEGAERAHQLTTTLEHLAIVGGFLLIVIHGAGALSFDTRRATGRWN
jgi:transmembrane protein